MFYQYVILPFKKDIAVNEPTLNIELCPFLNCEHRIYVQKTLIYVTKTQKHVKGHKNMFEDTYCMSSNIWTSFIRKVYKRKWLKHVLFQNLDVLKKSWTSSKKSGHAPKNVGHRIYVF